MCTFVSSSTIIGSALALMRNQKLTTEQTESLVSYIYKNYPDINILFSNDDISEMLNYFDDIVFEADDGFALRPGAKDKAKALFFEDLKPNIQTSLEKAVTAIL